MSESASITTTVMFADICGSTYLFSRLGDERAAALINETLQQAAMLVKKHQGVVLRTKGDDVLCIFSQPLNAIHASMDIHASMRLQTSPPARDLAMSIGINSGPALLSEGDILGDTVNIAARLSTFAKEGQTLVSSHTIDILGRLPATIIRPFGEITLKGKSEPVSTFEVLDASQQDEITQIGPTALHFPRSNRLTLNFQSREYQLKYPLERFLLGRNPECDLVLNHTLVSRHHAEIRYRNNEFILADISTNGTQLVSNSRSNLLHHCEAALHGSGSIFLGHTVNDRKYEIAFHVSGGSRAISQRYS